MKQLSVIVDKVQNDVFSESLSDGMFSLELNAQVAANFLLRGYCPLVGADSASYKLVGSGKDSVSKMLEKVRTHLESMPDVENFDDNKSISDSAGFSEVSLPQSSFILEYIIPNYMFHVSMVYAIARKNGVPLSKGDFDGLHSYPMGFRFKP
ncbi:DUF1993 domain-containing protein [Vibrio vulnificus]|uniref:DUF1993 family protein n=1 Tax=Grimontia TaxID=246861 RepID=UPI000A0295A7|nr:MULTISPECIES: DUF1993 family protein [Grimontia]MCU8395943.1 DUF1993 domain-containing protein [Vibrio vulnificus]MCU8540792.1 DUF1993 domain-containing protein [Vibrio vulnificus]MCU8545196.1 DUF1993 domain-containing protein [Vibrio vulnificus]WRV99173.1 DUF1993 family protein [Grimontia sp. NTOU-MAR1]